MMARIKQRPRRATAATAATNMTAAHDNIHAAMAQYNVAMTPRRSSRSLSTDAILGMASDTASGTNTATPPLSRDQHITSPATTTATAAALGLPRVPRRAATEDDSESRFVLGWVRANYQYEPNHNVPRSGMYEDYKASCARCHQQPVNSATFGKLIRHVFPGISTRRLGTRGESKYHYCGIRRRMVAAAHAPFAPLSLPAMSSATTDATAGFQVQQQIRQPVVVPHSTGPLSAGNIGTTTTVHAATRSTMSLVYTQPPQAIRPEPASQQQIMYGQPSSTFSPVFHLAPLVIHTPSLQSNQTAIEFSRAYEQHCRDILSFIHSGQVNNVCTCMASFYQMLPERFRNLIDDHPQVIEEIWRWDCSMYDSIMASMVPNSMRISLSFNTVNQLRNYTRELQSCIRESIDNSYPTELYRKKSGVAQVFLCKFKRHLKLNQMAQATQTILQHSSNFESMRRDWEAVDFDAILDQATWVCDCNHGEVQRILQYDIQELLRTEAGLEGWVRWIQALVERYIDPTQTSTVDHNHLVSLAKQFIHTCSFYSTLVLKDLSLGHAASAEQFRTLRHFFDDLMLFLVEDRIAKFHSNASSPSQLQSQPQPASASSLGSGAPVVADGPVTPATPTPMMRSAATTEVDTADSSSL